VTLRPVTGDHVRAILSCDLPRIQYIADGQCRFTMHEGDWGLDGDYQS
jgi:hypothetical protein